MTRIWLNPDDLFVAEMAAIEFYTSEHRAQPDTPAMLIQVGAWGYIWSATNSKPGVSPSLNEVRAGMVEAGYLTE